MKFLFTLSLALAAFTAHVDAAPPSRTQNEQAANQLAWMTNFQDAKALAKKQSKPLFLFFSGSDWCGWCTKISKEILETNEFSQAMGNDFVFVHVDFPKRKPLDSETQAQNDQLADTYNVKGFPTIIVLNSDLEVLGTLGYVKGGPQAFIEKARKLLNK